MLKPENQSRSRDPAPLFAALGDSTRLQLVTRLSNGRHYSIAQLSSGLALSRQGVTKHLQVLQQAGIVASRRIGREHQFHYVPQAIVPLESFLQRVSSQWDEALNRLQDYVETGPTARKRRLDKASKSD